MVGMPKGLDAPAPKKNRGSTMKNSRKKLLESSYKMEIFDKLYFHFSLSNIALKDSPMT